MPRTFSPTEKRVSRALTIAATVGLALVACWELFGPILAGHYASAASMGIIAENMQRWGIAAPVWLYTERPPTPDLYYCHHPWGIFWVTRALYWVFGRHDFVCRLPAVILSIATVPAVGALGRALYRPYAGAMAAVGFVVLPITLAFCQFNALEVPVMAHSALLLLGYVRLRQSGKKRHLALSVFGALFAMNSDWPAFVLVSGLLAIDLAALLFGSRRTRALASRRSFQWWALTATCAVSTFALYVFLFNRAGKWGDLVGSYGQRSSGNEAPLSRALADRRYWIELSFTPVAIVIGKLFAPIALARWAILRSREELVPLLVLVMATVQYVVFRQGADIHVFWPHYFAEYFALACSGVTATAMGLLERLELSASGRWSRALVAARASVVPVMLACLALVLRDGVVALGYARATGGRFNEKGLRIESAGDKIALLRWLAKSGRDVSLHSSMHASWAEIWALGGRVVPVDAGPPTLGATGVVVVDTRFVGAAAKSAWLRRYGVTAVGPFWVLEDEARPLQVFAFRETEPSFFEWYLVSGTEPHREITPDVMGSWELQSTYGLEVGPMPDADLGLDALDAHRIRHNAFRDLGDLGSADRERALMAAECEPISAELDDGTRIVCARFTPGASPKLTLVIEPARPFADDVELSVTSRVVERMALSTTMADPVVREVSFPFSLPPSLFKRGSLYAHTVRIRERPGVEVYQASFRGTKAPKASQPVEVLRR